MSWRRFRLILKHLPQESRYVTALRNTADPDRIPDPEPGVYGPWSQTDRLLADAVDLLAQRLYQASDGKGPKPEPTPRPGVASRQKVRAINPEAQAYLLARLRYMEENQGASPPPDWKPVLV